MNMAYSCKHCGKEFEKKQKLGGHSRTCQLNPRYQENLQQLAVARSQISFKDREKVQCDFCDKSYTSSAMNLHVWQYHGEGIEKHDPAIGYKNGTRQGWNKGLTKETDERIAKIAATCSLRTKGKPRPDRRKNLNLEEYRDYRYACSFKFNLADYPGEFDFGLVEQYGWYAAKNRGDNLCGVSRDHIISVKYGFENNVDVSVISHPANCRLMVHNSNVSKGKKCGMTLEQLEEKIKWWNEKYISRLG